MEIKTNYVVMGITIEGNEIKLILDNNLIKEQPSATGILKDTRGFIDRLKTEAVRAKSPDAIHIPLDGFNKMDINLGDAITIIVEK